MEHKLCWRCKEYLLNKYGPNFYKTPSDHCHHPEPQEKPKPLCWCDTPTFCYVLVGEHTVKAEFCPVCKKPREGWGK